MKLPKIYTYFHPGQLFTIDEARQKLGTSGNTLRKRLSELSLRGYLFPVRQGLYCLLPRDQISHNSSPYAIASKITPECHIGFKTALQFHANIIPPEKDTLFVLSQRKFNSFSFENRHFSWRQSSCQSGVEKHTVHHEGCEFQIQVTSFEKSLVDCLKRPANCPSFSELVYLCEKIDRIPDVEKILKYVSDSQFKVLFNRMGVLLEKVKETWDLEEYFFKELESKMKKNQSCWPIQQGSKCVDSDLFLHSQKSHFREHFSLRSLKRKWKIYFCD